MRILLIVLFSFWPTQALLSDELERIQGTRGYEEVRFKELATSSFVDLRDAVFILSNSRNSQPTKQRDCETGSDRLNRYPFHLLDSNEVHISGGRFDGRVPLGTDWLWTYCNSTAMRISGSPGTNISRVRIRRAWDAIRLGRDSGSFRISESWISQVRDDCVENDYLMSGEIRDTLFDGCFSGVSVAPVKSLSRRNPKMRMFGVLLRMSPFTYRNRLTHALPVKNHGNQFRLEIRDSVIAVEAKDLVGQKYIRKMWRSVSECSNNLLLWLGPGSLPSDLRPPKNCFQIVVGKQAHAAWKNARRNWIDCHPELKRFSDDPKSRQTRCRRNTYGGTLVQNQ